MNRAAWAAIVVFLANAGLLVLQLVAGRLLAPFIGMSLETWTTVIGVFLAGISIGNWLGGRLADRAASERTLGILLLAGAASVLTCLAICRGLGEGGPIRALPLSIRIPILTTATCLLPSLVLSLITPVTIRILLPDVAHTGRVVGLVYALGTLGSLAGNFLTGFVLLAYFTTTTAVLAIAGALAVLGLITLWLGSSATASATQTSIAEKTSLKIPGEHMALRSACATVFAASFCSMAAEIGASRFLAPIIGVSMYSWTAIIGVVLAGVFAGNWIGGRLADRSPSRSTLGTCLFAAGLFTMLVPVISALAMHKRLFAGPNLIANMVSWAAALFAIPMFLLGTISPQVTRLAVGDLEHAGRVAGRVYAWSCAGAIVGTFAAGYGLVAKLGVHGLFFGLSLGLIALSLAVGSAWRRPGELFGASIVAGAAITGLFVKANLQDLRSLASSAGWQYENKLASPYAMETNYYAIGVYDKNYHDEPVRALSLDHLEHSYVKGEAEEETVKVQRPFAGSIEEVQAKKWTAEEPEVKAGKWKVGDEKFKADTSFMGYEHEQVQAEFARLAAVRSPQAKMLVIGGGGYTLPRWAEANVPNLSVEVCEIDPGVTEICHRMLGLPRDTWIQSHHMDGRQFVQERGGKGTYQLVVQDAVNDLSVPYHIMTKQYNDAVAKLLDDSGIYLLTVIDHFEEGRLMRSAVKTLKETFPHVDLMAQSELWKDGGQSVFVIYASKKPFNAEEMAAALKKVGAPESVIKVMPDTLLRVYLTDPERPPVILTDEYAPVDNLISIVFKLRAQSRRQPE